MHSPILSRRSLFGGLAGATALAAIGAPRLVLAQTEAAPVFRPTFYDRKIGDMTITTLLDGSFGLGLDILTNADPAVVEASLAAAYLDPKVAIPIPITAYVLRAGDQITLIDAGAGMAFGPSAGRLIPTLAAAGIAPEAVNRVILTHMHPDHIGGMMTGEAATFANASVHVSATDLKFWTDEAIAASVPESAQGFFALARAVTTAYGDRVTPFDGDADLGGGVTAIAMNGHTPGHTGYRLSSGSDQLIVWGDTAALAALQFSHPDIGITFDADGPAAAETRKKVLAMAVADKIAVSGCHLPFPGFGHVEAKDGAFAWVPEEWKL